VSAAQTDATEVLRVRDLPSGALIEVLQRYSLGLEQRELPEQIPGSYWGESEAGLIGTTVYLRIDTPIHSVLHEASHCICMTAERRSALSKDAGGDYDEENAVCYLQILLADHLPTVGRDRMLRDMDTWGYTFRLGSARAWFENDAEDARAWLMSASLIDREGRVMWTMRE
jgi:hypothetical protein